MIIPGMVSSHDRQSIDEFVTESVAKLENLAERCVQGEPGAPEVFSKAMDECLLQGAIELQARFPEHNATAKKYFQERISPFLSASVWWRQVFHKPRGYAGDYLAMDMMYCSRPLPVSGPHRYSDLIDEWYLNCPSAQACRNRNSYMVENLRTSAEAGGVRVASLASGPCREVRDFLDSESDGHVKTDFVLVDIDDMALRYARELLDGAANRYRGCDAVFEFLRANLIKVALGTKIPSLAQCDLIYSHGFADYLDDGLLIKFIESAHGMLSPGGKLILGQFAERDAPPDRFGMEWMLDWHLIYRTQERVHDIFSKTSFANLLEISTDPTGLILFAEARKA